MDFTCLFGLVCWTILSKLWLHFQPQSVCVSLLMPNRLLHLQMVSVDADSLWITLSVQGWHSRSSNSRRLQLRSSSSCRRSPKCHPSVPHQWCFLLQSHLLHALLPGSTSSWEIPPSVRASSFRSSFTSPHRMASQIKPRSYFSPSCWQTKYSNEPPRCGRRAASHNPPMSTSSPCFSESLGTQRRARSESICLQSSRRRGWQNMPLSFTP